jgi:hypothetical protein
MVAYEWALLLPLSLLWPLFYEVFLEAVGNYKDGWLASPFE